MRAVAVRMPTAPWGAAAEEAADALVLLGDGELTVLSYPDSTAARAGFAAHVAAREAAGDPYDYVTIPGQQRRTALPPGFGAWRAGEESPSEH